MKKKTRIQLYKWLIVASGVILVPALVWFAASRLNPSSVPVGNAKPVADVVLDISPYEDPYEAADTDAAEKGIEGGEPSGEGVSAEPVMIVSVSETAGEDASKELPVTDEEQKSLEPSSTPDGGPSTEAIPSAKPAETQSGTQLGTSSELPAGTSTTAPVEESILPEQPLPSSTDWLSQKVREYESEITDEDYADFLKILEKLDQPWIESIAADDVTKDEEDLLRAHLSERLSMDEYERAKELFFLYNWLLEEV